MKKLFAFIILIVLLYFAANTQTLQRKIIDTIPAMLIICDTSKGFQTTNSNQYNGLLLCKCSTMGNSVKSINGYIIKGLVDDTPNPWGEQHYVCIFKYLDNEMRPINSKWVVQWKTN